jgi:hypothetical protein
MMRLSRHSSDRCWREKRGKAPFKATAALIPARHWFNLLLTHFRISIWTPALHHMHAKCFSDGKSPNIAHCGVAKRSAPFLGCVLSNLIVLESSAGATGYESEYIPECSTCPKAMLLPPWGMMMDGTDHKQYFVKARLAICLDSCTH